MDKKYFGTDGIRGRVGKALINAEFMLKLGWAVGKVLVSDRNAKVIIGKDTRISGYMVESALQAGFSAAGVDCYLLGPLPTPAVAHLTHSLRASVGVVISASHNPYYDNGVKFFDQDGMKLSDEIEATIEEYIDRPMRTERAENLGKIYRVKDAEGRYVEYCKSIFPAELSLKGIKIVVDCANGATYSVAPKIFHELGADVVSIHDQPDGFNINQECGATDVKDLQRQVIEHSADLGIALDGDGDRIIMVDHKGERVDGDELLAIIATDANQPKIPGVVGTLMTNLGLEQAMAAQKIEFTRAKVGDRYVLEELQKRGWKLGGENSGHIVNLSYTTTGDGVISALQILRILLTSGKSLNALKQVMIKRPQILINVPAFGDKDLSKYPGIHAAVNDLENELQSEGRVLLRPSGTEPLIRVMVEGNDEVKVREAAQRLAKTVEQELS